MNTHLQAFSQGPAGFPTPALISLSIGVSMSSTVSPLRKIADIQLKAVRSNSSKSFAKISKQFFCGPIDLVWLHKAAQCPARSLHLAIMIVHKAKITSCPEVSLTTKAIGPFGLSRSNCYRAVSELEKAGLIEVVERRSGKAIVVRAVGYNPREVENAPSK